MFILFGGFIVMGFVAYFVGKAQGEQKGITQVQGLKELTSAQREAAKDEVYADVVSTTYEKALKAAKQGQDVLTEQLLTSQGKKIEEQKAELRELRRKLEA